LKTNVAILISGTGTNMVELIKGMKEDHPGKPCVVVSSNPEAAGITKAANLDIKTYIVNKNNFGSDKRAFEEKLNEILFRHEAEVICLAGFMHILSDDFVSLWNKNLLNIHPSLLPKFKGLNTHKRAIEAGEKETGCTVHLVTPNLDDGPILGQTRVPILCDDTTETLRKRVLDNEIILYTNVLREFLIERIKMLPLNN